MRLSELLRSVDWAAFAGSVVERKGRRVIVALRDADGCCPIVHALVEGRDPRSNPGAVGIATRAGVNELSALALALAADHNRMGCDGHILTFPRYGAPVRKAATKLRRWMCRQIVEAIHPGVEVTRV